MYWKETMIMGKLGICAFGIYELVVRANKTESNSMYMNLDNRTTYVQGCIDSD